MMKLAWLCYSFDSEDDPDDLYPVIRFVEPESK